MFSKRRVWTWISIVAGWIVVVGSGGTGGVAAQDPTRVLATLRELRLDSLRTDRAVTYFRKADSVRAGQLHRDLAAFAVTARDLTGKDFAVRLAAVSRGDWSRLSRWPYGFPNNIGPPADLIVAASELREPEGADTLIQGGTADLLYTGHEGGHLLTWSLMPAAMRDSASVADDQMSAQLRTRFARFDSVPGWYWEFAANYVALLFLEGRSGDDAQKVLNYMTTMSSWPTPEFHSLDVWLNGMMQARTPSGGPYMASPAGRLNFAWYQGIVGVMADHVRRTRGRSYLEDVRRMVAAEGPIRTEDIIAEMESRSPGLQRLLDSLGVDYVSGAGGRGQRLPLR